MKIVSWSPMHGLGTTSNTIAVSLLTGMLHRKDTLLTQTHFNFNNLEAPLIDKNPKNNASQSYFQGIGIDTLIRNFKASKPDKEMLDLCSITLPNTNLKLLPGTTKNNREMFENEMDLILPKLIPDIEEFTDIIFIDVNSGNNLLSMKLIAGSDLTIINFNQNIGLIDTFFASYDLKKFGNVFYLFGNYEGRSKFNINNIRRRYKNINTGNSSVIPYNVAYMDALVDGKVLGYFKDNIRCTKTDENYYFMAKTRRATEKILMRSGISSTTNEGE